MTYGMFLGCLVPNRYPGIEWATNYILGKNQLDVPTAPVDDFSCCPVPGIFYSADKDTWLSLAARNLVAAQDQNLEVLTLCNGCFMSLHKAAEYLQDPKKRSQVNKVLRGIGKRYTGEELPSDGRITQYRPIQVKHLVDILINDVGIERLKEKVTHPLTDLRVAVHYGCHYLRPSESYQIEDPNHPHYIDDIVEACGSISVDYEEKLSCCGAGGGVRSHVKELADALTADKVKSITDARADVIVTGCPFCLLQFDTAQASLPGFSIPAVHISNFVALALGADPLFLGFDLHNVSVNPLLRKLRRKVPS
jgi:heterodisulfide reductase subunit B